MQKLPSRTLIYDISNILFRVAAVQKAKNPYAREASAEDLVGLCMHISLLSIHKWYEKYRPDFIVFAFEGADNWRKQYTAKARSRKQYKGNRVVDPEMQHYFELIASFRETMTANTSVCCLSVPGMEADDSIAAYCQLYAKDDHEIFIISGDRDYVQLLKLPKVFLVNPDDGKLRNQPGQKDYESDIDYWLFKKCVRGDMGDYVPSAFPRVRETRIRAAYEKDFERLSMMNELWRDEEGVTHRVGDLYAENVVLLSLYDQPPELREYLLAEIDKQTKETRTYNHFHFLRFLAEYKLESVRREAVRFADMFSNNQRFLKGTLQSAPLTEEVIKDHTVDEPSTAPSVNRLLEF